MRCLSGAFPTVATCLILCAPGAHAELTAETVWSDWQTYIRSLGYQTEGTATRSGNQLIISGVTMTTTPANDAGGVSIAMDRIVMTEQGDGSVDIALPSVMPMIVSTPQAEGGATRASLDYRHDGMTIRASGDPDALRYTYSARSFTLQTTGLEVDGNILPPDASSVEVTFEDMSGTADSIPDTTHRYEQSLQVAAVRYSIRATDPETQGKSDVTGQMQGMTFTGQTSVPPVSGDPGDMSAMLSAGMTAQGTFATAANAMTMALSTPAGLSEASLISGPATLAVSMEGAGLTYDVRQTDIEAEMTAAQFPLPLNFTMGEAAFNMAVPLRQTETAQDFALGLDMSRFSPSDMLWGMLDPTGQLPRDPMTIALDLAGKARLLFDILDPGAVATASPESAPAEIETLDIRRLRIAAAGAELTGAGGFTFDNSADGPPKPTGAVDLMLSGGNGLIDKLIAIGLLPEQQAMGVRMMMGLLASPGDAPDTLNSKIEVNEEGHVLANGQRIR